LKQNLVVVVEKRATIDAGILAIVDSILLYGATVKK